MSQTTQLLSTLKRCLRARGLTYRDVAEALGLSEASVKRVFAEESFSLRRLEEVCQLLDMSIPELARLAEREGGGLPDTLSEAQEAALADAPALLTYFYLLINGWEPAQINAQYGIDGPTAVGLLARLDRLRLIELQPHDRVRLRTARTIRWRKHGPVRRLYEQQVKAQFMAYGFEGEDELLSLETGELTAASVQILKRRLAQVLADFDQLAELDLKAPAEAKRGVGLMVALRPWVFAMVPPPQPR